MYRGHHTPKGAYTQNGKRCCQDERNVDGQHAGRCCGRFQAIQMYRKAATDSLLNSFPRLISRYVMEPNDTKIMRLWSYQMWSPCKAEPSTHRGPMGKMVVSVVATIAEFERDLIRERVVAGMKEARREGKHCGRPPKEFDVEKAAGLRVAGMSWRKLEAATGVPMHLLRSRLTQAAPIS
jgi:hypothetical protein